MLDSRRWRAAEARAPCHVIRLAARLQLAFGRVACSGPGPRKQTGHGFSSSGTFSVEPTHLLAPPPSSPGCPPPALRPPGPDRSLRLKHVGGAEDEGGERAAQQDHHPARTRPEDLGTEGRAKAPVTHVHGLKCRTLTSLMFALAAWLQANISIVIVGRTGNQVQVESSLGGFGTETHTGAASGGCTVRCDRW